MVECFFFVIWGFKFNIVKLAEVGLVIYEWVVLKMSPAEPVTGKLDCYKCFYSHAKVYL